MIVVILLSDVFFASERSAPHFLKLLSFYFFSFPKCLAFVALFDFSLGIWASFRKTQTNSKKQKQNGLKNERCSFCLANLDDFTYRKFPTNAQNNRTEFFLSMKYKKKLKNYNQLNIVFFKSILDDQCIKF